MTSLRVLASLCFSWMALLPIAQAGKLAPLPLRMDGGAADPRRDRFHDAVARGLSQGAPAGLAVVSGADVRAQLQGELAGCAEGACVSGAARALGADRLVVSEVAVTGKNYSITLRALDAAGAELSRTADRCDICSVREADDALARAAARLAAMIAVPTEAKVEAPRPPPVKVEAPPPVKVEAPPPALKTDLDTPPPPARGAAPPLPPQALPPTGGDAARPNPLYRYGWIASLAAGGALIAAGVPFLIYAGRDGQITCAEGTNPKQCPTIYKGNTATGAALMATGLVVGGAGFGVFYFLDHRERQRASGRVGLSTSPGGALLTAEGRF